MLIYKIPFTDEIKKKIEEQNKNLKGNLKGAPINPNIPNPVVYNTQQNFKKIMSQQTSSFLKEQRCIYMTMKQYEDKEHINKNMCCIEFTENIHNIKSGILQKLEEVSKKIQVPYNNNSIPLPIYVSIAKIIEKDNNYLLYKKFIKDNNDYSKTFQEKYTFQGKINIIIYIPNLMNNVYDYTYYPSIEAYTNQNKWMELITHPRSHFLGPINNIISNNNVYKKISENICNDYGCVANAKEDINSMLSMFFFPTKCLQDNNYKTNMKVDFNDRFDIKQMNGYDHDLKNAYEDTYTELVDERTNKGDDDEDDKKDSDDNNELLTEEELKDIKINSLTIAIKDEYSDSIRKGYNKKITEDFKLRNKSSFPGIQEINYKMFKLNPSSDLFTNKVNFHYMPWGDKLINNQYVLNEDKTFDFEDIKYVSKDKTENKIIKFKSLNDKHYMKFSNEGKLAIYDNASDVKITDVQYLSNIELINKNRKNVYFDSSGVLYFNSNGEELSKNIKIKNLSLNPYSIMLDENNPGNLLIYGMGFEEISYS